MLLPVRSSSPYPSAPVSCRTFWPPLTDQASLPRLSIDPGLVANALLAAIYATPRPAPVTAKPPKQGSDKWRLWPRPNGSSEVAGNYCCSSSLLKFEQVCVPSRKKLNRFFAIWKSSKTAELFTIDRTRQIKPTCILSKRRQKEERTLRNNWWTFS